MIDRTLRAHAKLNVFLRVLGRRDDGFHDIETVILPLELYDDVRVRLGTGEEGVTVEVEQLVDGEPTPEGEGNLAARAAEMFAEATGVHRHGVHIDIVKRIPVAAGLGGGSADAAAVLRVLGDDRGLAPAALADLAEHLGSDVPAMLEGSPVYATGRGERVVPVHVQPTVWVVAPFPFSVSTPDAYEWWDGAPETGPDPGALIAALESGNDELLGSALFNDLQPGVVSHHPAIDNTIQPFLERSALGVVMTGSGPTVVALARHLGHADALAAQVPGSFVTTAPPRTMGAPSGVV